MHPTEALRFQQGERREHLDPTEVIFQTPSKSCTEALGSKKQQSGQASHYSRVN